MATYELNTLPWKQILDFSEKSAGIRSFDQVLQRSILDGLRSVFFLPVLDRGFFKLQVRCKKLRRSNELFSLGH